MIFPALLGKGGLNVRCTCFTKWDTWCVHIPTSIYLHLVTYACVIIWYGHASIYHMNWLTTFTYEQPYRQSFDKLPRPKPAPARSHSQPAVVSRETRPGGSKSETLVRVSEGLWQSCGHAIHDLSTIQELFRSGFWTTSIGCTCLLAENPSVFQMCVKQLGTKKQNDLLPVSTNKQSTLGTNNNIYIITFHFGKAWNSWNHH